MQKDWSIPSESVYYYFEECLEELKERDLVLGFRKTFLDKEKDKNMLTMLQLRDFHGAEEICDEILAKSQVLDPTQETLKGYIEKHIYEEATIEIQKNFNEWGNLFEASKETQRRDLLIESAYYTQNIDYMEQLLRQNIDEEVSIDNYMFYIYSLMVNDSRTEPFEKKGVLTFKETIYLRLMHKWFHLPKVFCENYIVQVYQACLWNEFEEGLDIIQEFMTQKKNPEQKSLQHLTKFKEEVTGSYYYIFRQRLPNEADGLVNAKRILEQRSLISYHIHNLLKNYLENQVIRSTTAQGTLYDFSDPKKYNSYNETLFNSVMYCRLERNYGIYNSILNVAKEADKMIGEKQVASQVDEYYYYYELIKYWEADDDQKELPEKMLARLRQQSGPQSETKDLRDELKCDLFATIMEGYLEKNNLEKANEYGIESIKYGKDSMNVWCLWFQFFKKLYHQQSKTENLIYLKDMIRSFTKITKYPNSNNFLLFNEILNALYFRDDLIKSKFNSDENLKGEVIKAFEAMLREQPIWTWTVWLGNLLLNVYKKNSIRLDECILEAVRMASLQYRYFVHHVLNSILMSSSEKDKSLKEIYDSICSNPLGHLRFHDEDGYFGKLTSIFEHEDLHNKNDHPETISSIYTYQTIESKQISQINAKCKDIGEGYNQLKNLDNSQRLLTLIKMIDDYLAGQKSILNKKPVKSLSTKTLGARVGILNPATVYTDKNLPEFYTDVYLLPETKVVYESRRFCLQVEFLNTKHQKLVYTLRKPSVNSVYLMSYNHYIKILNSEFCSNNETVYRMLRFEPLDMMYLEDDYCLKSKPATEISLIDVLDEEMESNKLKVDQAIDLFAAKKGVNDVNKIMMELTKNTVLKREVLKRLKSQYDIFLWKKRYAQSLGTNMINSLLFVKGRLA